MRNNDRAQCFFDVAASRCFDSVHSHIPNERSTMTAKASTAAFDGGLFSPTFFKLICTRLLAPFPFVLVIVTLPCLERHKHALPTLLADPAVAGLGKPPQLHDLLRSEGVRIPLLQRFP
jgi:hypothetical protein